MATSPFYFKVFPVAAAVREVINESFGRIYIPDTFPPRKYARARSCCVHVPGYKCPGHCATDFAKGFANALFRAPVDGELRLHQGDDFGNALTIILPKGRGLFFAHFRNYGKGITSGMKVKAGQLLARVGRSGNTSGVHVHGEGRTQWENWCSAVPIYHELLDAQARMRAGK